MEKPTLLPDPMLVEFSYRLSGRTFRIGNPRGAAHVVASATEAQIVVSSRERQALIVVTEDTLRACLAAIERAKCELGS